MDYRTSEQAKYEPVKPLISEQDKKLADRLPKNARDTLCENIHQHIEQVARDYGIPLEQNVGV